MNRCGRLIDKSIKDGEYAFVVKTDKDTYRNMKKLRS